LSWEATVFARSRTSFAIANCLHGTGFKRTVDLTFSDGRQHLITLSEYRDWHLSVPGPAY
jgi:hypothetical protein